MEYALFVGGCFAFGLDDPSWIVNWSFIDFAGRDFKQNIYYCFALTSPETKAQIAWFTDGY